MNCCPHHDLDHIREFVTNGTDDGSRIIRVYCTLCPCCTDFAKITVQPTEIKDTATEIHA